MLSNLLPLPGGMAWPVAIAVAWVVGELGHRLTSLPRISLYGLVGFALGNTRLGVDQVAPLAAATLLLELAGPVVTQRALIIAGESSDAAEA